MTFDELIQKAEAQGIIINDTDIFAWLHSTDDEKIINQYLENDTLPNNVSVIEVQKAGKQLIAC